MGDGRNDFLPDSAAGSNSLSPRTAPGRTDLTILFILIYILPPMNDDSNWSLLLLEPLVEAPKYLLRHLFASTFVYKAVSSTPMNALLAVNFYLTLADHILVAGILASLGKVAKIAADAVIGVCI